MMQSRFYIALLLLLSLIYASLAQNLHWQQVNPHQDSPIPPKRKGSSLAWSQIALYIFGGENSNGVLGMVTAYMCNFLSACFDAYAHLAHFHLNLIFLDDMWKFSLLTHEWEELRQIKKPAGRYGYVSGTYEDYWYISHGQLIHSQCVVGCIVYSYCIIVQNLPHISVI